MFKTISLVLMFVAFSTIVFGCDPKSGNYVWSEITGKASYPPGYNYSVFVFGNWMVAMNKGAWLSTDGEKWVKTDLPDSGLNSAYQKYVQFHGAIYALGTMTGNYENLNLTTKIARTRDFRTWNTVAVRSNLPKRVFYGSAVFGDKIWIVGGYDGRNYYNDVWNSSDGVHWNRVAESTAWSARGTKLIVFKNKLWIIGGGVIDGQRNPNPGSDTEMWSSTNGIKWTKVETNSPGKWAGTPVVFDDKLWLVGANRNDGNFSNALWVSDDGINWRKQSTPWSPRGGVAVWEFGGKLYMTGGKFSYTAGGEIKFVYCNDVWAMIRKEG